MVLLVGCDEYVFLEICLELFFNGQRQKQFFLNLSLKCLAVHVCLSPY